MIRTSISSRGLAPGTPIFIGEQKTEQVRITIIDYLDNHIETSVAQSVQDCAPYKDTSTVTWINMDGLHDVTLVEQLGRLFNLHPLTIEDIVNTEQRPKTDLFDTYLLIIVKMHMYDDTHAKIVTEHVSIILGDNFVLTFQEEGGDVFEAIRQRIHHNKGRIRKAGPDYLVFSLLDAIVDSYFDVLEQIGEHIEDIEEKLIASPESALLEEIHDLRRTLLYFRKSTWPLRSIVNELSRQDNPLLQRSTTLYFRDLYDHVAQVIETIELFREMVAGNLEVYLSSVSNKMNEVMQFLTIIGTIFIPLTFIVGVYGMNFDHIPELSWRWGYFAVWGVMIGITVLLLLYFKKKHWL